MMAISAKRLGLTDVEAAILNHHGPENVRSL